MRKGWKNLITSLNQARREKTSSKHLHVTYGYHLIAVFLISSLCIIIYADTLHCPFVFDDVGNITDNPHIRLISLDLQKLYDSAFKSPALRPVANISFAMNYYFGRYAVTGYHLVNIIIHLINGILVYFLALTIFSQVRPLYEQPLDQSNTVPIYLMSLFSALFFVAHPLQTQSVTYIVQRMNSLSAMFFLLSLLLYVCGRLSQIKWARLIMFAVCFVSWILALGSKQIAITLPLIVLLYEWCFFQDLSTSWIRRNFKYLFSLIAVICVFTFIHLGNSPIDNILASYEHRDFTMWERVLTQFRVVIFYISLLFYPHPSRLNLCHHFTTSHSLLNPITTLFSLLTVLGFVGLALCLGKKKRLISFCILWYFINLSVESSFIGLEMIFEHRLYLPMVGPALIASYLVFYLLLKRRSLAVIISASIALSLGAGTCLRNRVWQDRITLWRDVVSKNPSHRAHHNLGFSLAAQKKFHEAIENYNKALLIKPIHWESYNYAQCHNNLGISLESLGDSDKALWHYTEALRIYSELPEAHNNLGMLLEKQGKRQKAIDHYFKVIHLDPYYVDAHINLGLALLKQRKINEAFFHLNEAIRIDPQNVAAFNNLGIAFTTQNMWGEAVRSFSEVLRIKPDDARAHYNLGLAFMAQNRKTQAVEHLSEALRIRPGYRAAQEGLKNAMKIRGQ